MFPSALRVIPLLFALTPLLAAEGPAAGGAPSIKFDEMTHDFGTIRSDAKQTFSWSYRNVGTAPLEILSTAPSCGCTVSSADEEAVPPGGRGALKIVYDPAGQSGGVRKSIAVVTNDPDNRRTILTLMAHVIPADEEPMRGGHPRFTGQSLLMGSCASCHAKPAAGKSGTALYAAVCAMCHGASAEGGLAPGLRAEAFLAGHDDKALGELVAYGTSSPKMPGFSDVMGGPLDAAQVASLVKVLRTWGPSDAASPPAPHPKR